MVDHGSRVTPADPTPTAIGQWNLHNFITAAAADWRISRTAIIAIVILPFVVVFTLAVMS